jgi:hypothetical protein
MRREYKIDIEVNNRKIKTLIIDPHYEKKHSQSVNDEIILTLVESLNNGHFVLEGKDDDFKYYVTEPHYYEGKPYKLIWLLPLKGNYMVL